MKKSVKGISLTLAMILGMSLMAGCGKQDKNSGFKNSEELIDKFSAYCDLGEYKGVDYEETKTEVTDDMVQSQVDSFIQGYATTTDALEGTAASGDTVNIDFVGSVDGEEFEGGASDEGGYDLTLGSGTFIEGFEEQIIGHKVGDSFDVNVTFPEDYGKEELQGKDAVFAVTINSIRITSNPDYTDEFVSQNTEYSTIKEYEESVKSELEKSCADSDERSNKASIVNVVLDNATINEYPQEYMEQKVDEAVESVEATAENYGYDLATYVTAVYGMKSEQAFKDYVSEQIKDMIDEMIVICAIAKAEGIEVSNDEINEYKKETAELYGVDVSELDQYYDDEEFMYGALAEKVADFLLENNNPVPAGTLTDEATSSDAQ